MERPHVLLVHNEPAIRRLALEAVGLEPVRLSHAASVAEGVMLLKDERVHVLVTSLELAGVDDEFLRYAASIHPFLGAVLIASPARLDRPARFGSDRPVQYVSEPVRQDALRSAILKAIQLQKEPAPQQTAAPSPTRRDGEPAGGNDSRIVAASKAMREIMALARRTAVSDAPVLICGEPDTGKAMIAKEIHRQSRRAAGPMVRVACGVLRESQIAECLFGHRAFSPGGGPDVQPSFLDEARGGTLFLDNVAQLPMWAQFELLDVLQHGRPLRAAGGGRVAPDVRVIASIWGNPSTLVSQDAFASSLYYYLKVVEIYVPPLRHRPQDIPALAEIYLERANATCVGRPARPPCRLTEEALECLSAYDWPGNTLQLASVIAHAVLLSDSREIGRGAIIEAFGQTVVQNASDTVTVPLVGGLKEIERTIIDAVIERCRGNKAAAARVLRLHRRTLYRMLQEDASPAKGAAPVLFPPVNGVDACSVNVNA